MNASKMEGPAWERFADVTHRLTNERAGVKQVTMFGAPCISVNGKGFAAFDGDGRALKLTGEAHSRALALPGAHLWDPLGAWARHAGVGTHPRDRDRRVGRARRRLLRLRRRRVTPA